MDILYLNSEFGRALITEGPLVFWDEPSRTQGHGCNSYTLVIAAVFVL